MSEINTSRRPSRSVSDTHLIEVEYYNPNKFAIEVIRDDRFFSYIYQNKISIGPRRTILKPDDFIVLPHQYYILKTIDGPEIFDLVVNMGNAKRIGNKLPSLPVLE